MIEILGCETPETVSTEDQILQVLETTSATLYEIVKLQKKILKALNAKETDWK